MSGILSKGIVLSHMVALVATPIDDLQEMPELGGKADKVEVTTLDDSSKRYIEGIRDYGDLKFTFLYDNSLATSNYRVLKALEVAGTIEEFTIAFPDTTIFTFSASVTTAIDTAKVGDALTFNASFALDSEIVVTNPVVMP